MRSAHVVWLGLLAALTAGCLHERTSQSTPLLDRFRQLGGPSGPNAVYIDYALVERPAGETRITRDIWIQADEQVVPAENRAVIEENGFRVGVIGGLMSSDVQSLWANPKSTLGRRQRRLYTGNDAPLVVNGPLPECRYQVYSPSTSGPTVATLEQAQCSLILTPAVDGSKVRIRFAPEIQHHDRKHWTPPGAVGAGWVSGAKPVERFPELTWEVALTPTEVAVVGTSYDRDETVGYQFFTGLNGKNRVQRLLLIRAGRVTGAPAGGVTLDEDSPVQSDGPKPLAEQARSTLSSRRDR